MPDDLLAGQAAPGESQTTATTAAAQTNAATAQPQTDGGAGGDGGNPEVPATKTFTQKEVDDIVKRAKASTESKTERRILRTLERVLPHQQQGQSQSQHTSQHQSNDDGRPTRKEGEKDDDYLDRLTDWKLEQRERKAESEREHAKARDLGKKTNSLYAEAEKLGDDFDRDEFDAHLTKPIAEALVESADGARLMHFLGSNPEEMQRISQLSTARQHAELGKLETRLEAEAKAAAEKKPPQRSQAPQALAPAKGHATGSMPDPADTKAYIKWANDQERAARA